MCCCCPYPPTSSLPTVTAAGTTWETNRAEDERKSQFCLLQQLFDFSIPKGGREREEREREKEKEGERELEGMIG
jgi:hypothetical protein